MNEETVDAELIEAQKDAIAVVYDPEQKVEYLRIENNTVVNSILVEDSAAGADLVAGLDGTWVKNIFSYPEEQKPVIGWTCNVAKDEFKSPKPWPSWSFSETTWGWQPPTPEPLDGNIWLWYEDTLSWVKID